MGVVRNLMTRFGADASGFVNGTKKAGKAMTQYQKTMSAAAKGIKNALGAVGVSFAFGAIISGLKGCYEAYQDQAEAETQLASVMRTTMGASNAEIASIKALTGAQQQLGVIGDEVQLAGAQELATYLGLSSSLETLIPTMNDMVAQQYGLSASAEQATQIATMLGKVMEGQTGALSRYGYYFDEAQKKVLQYGTEAERAAMLSEIVADSVGGMNQALAQTDVGRVQQLKNAFGDVKEQFGLAASELVQGLMPALNAVVNGLSRVAQWALIAGRYMRVLLTGSNGQDAGAVIGAAGALSDAAEETATSVGGAAKALKNATAGFDKLNILKFDSDSGGGGTTSSTAKTPDLSYLDSVVEEADFSEIEEKAAKVREAIEDLPNRWQKVKQMYKDFFAPAVEWNRKISSGWDKMTTGIDNWFRNAISADLEIFRSLWETTKERFLGFVADIKTGWDNFSADVKVGWENLKTAWSEMISGLKEKWENFIGGIREKWNNFKSDLQTGWQNLKNAWSEMISGIKEKWGTFTDGLKNGWNTVSEKLRTGWEGFKNGWSEAVSSTLTKMGEFKTRVSQGATQVWQSIKSAFREGVNTVIRWLNKLGSFEIDPITVMGKQIFAGASVKLWSIPELQAYAGGGFPTAGSVFLAGERGPEMVGTMGGKTAVANSSQIVSGIATGVAQANTGLINAMYEAVRELRQEIRESGDVYMDGRKVTDEVTRRQNRRAGQTARSAVMA